MLARAGSGDHCDRLEGLNLRCHSRNGEVGMDVRDLVDIESIVCILDKLDVEVSRKRQKLQITPKLWVARRMEVP